MTGGTLYFGYGSNLWKDQMVRRCPTSQYKGVARLNKYRWIINERGYANVEETGKSKDVVYGLYYLLKKADEEKLDKNENVPIAYTKEDIELELWSPSQGSNRVNISDKPESHKMLVYINRDQVTPSDPKKEYIYRMNKGISDALDAGIPKDYVDHVLRHYIPKDHDKDAEAQAEKQALHFREE